MDCAVSIAWVCSPKALLPAPALLILGQALMLCGSGGLENVFYCRGLVPRHLTAL